MLRPFRFPSAIRRDPAVAAWFDAMRACGDDVRELLHDGQPTACAGELAFAYVDAFKAHVNVGFFNGSELADPAGLLEGAGKFMRHVKLVPGQAIAIDALARLIAQSHADAAAAR